MEHYHFYWRKIACKTLSFASLALRAGGFALFSRLAGAGAYFGQESLI
jgi:hypothetical protein